MVTTNYYHVPFLETFSRGDVRYWVSKFEQHMLNTGQADGQYIN